MQLTNPRRGNRITLAVLGADAILIAVALGTQIEDTGITPGLLFPLVIAGLVAGLAIVGRLIVLRQPGNAVGWIFIASSIGFAVTTLAYSWTSLSLDRFGGALPGTVFAAWLNAWDGIPILVTLIIFVPLLFPNGRLLSARWRWVAAFAAVGIGGTTVGSALTPGPMNPSQIPNPIGIDVGQPLRDILGIVDSLAGVVVFGLAIVALVIRYRRGSAIERLQLRWFAFPMTIAILCIGVSNFVQLGVVSDAAWIIGIVAIATTPLAIGIAILRYRLYEIDFLLNRTAVYALVSAVLAALFVLGNVALQYGLESVTHQRSELLSGALGVGVGLLFVPMRRWIRPLVDRVLPGRAMLALLFTDIVGSTQTIVDIGDQRWRALLAEYLAVVRAELARHGGHEVNTAGDAFFATFIRPMDALRAAWAIRAAVRSVGLETRTGLHLGEVEMRGEQVSGLAVHTAARVMAAAGDGEVLVSDAMREAIGAASAVGVALRDRGRHELKGVPGSWQLYAVENPG